MLSSSRIIVLDDEPRNVQLLERILESAGFHSVIALLDPELLLPTCRAALPDLVILDLHMPGLDGFTLLGELTQEFRRARYLPILVLTADRSEASRRRALGAGASDFLTKPFSLTEALLRIRNLLETRALYLRLEQHNATLAELVDARTRELEESRLEVLERLCQAVEFRDDLTGAHTRRVAQGAAELAAAVGLPAEEVDLIRRAAPLHDVGKVGIPDSILLKPGTLTAGEARTMQHHTTIGSRILAGGRSPLMSLAEKIARCHHERWDGRGYPEGLQEERIPIAARIVSIADVYDALTTSRPYRPAWHHSAALEAIRAGAGKQFDPELVEAFLRLRST